MNHCNSFPETMPDSPCRVFSGCLTFFLTLKTEDLEDQKCVLTLSFPVPDSCCPHHFKLRLMLCCEESPALRGAQMHDPAAASEQATSCQLRCGNSVGACSYKQQQQLPTATAVCCLSPAFLTSKCHSVCLWGPWSQQPPHSAGLTGSGVLDGRNSMETSPEMWSFFRHLRSELWLCSGKVQTGSPQSSPQVYVKFYGFTSSHCCCYPK